MIANGKGGSIVNVSSVVSTTGFALLTVYSKFIFKVNQIFMSSNVCMQHFCRVIVDIQNNIHFLFLIVFCKNSPQNSVSVID